MAVEKRRAMDNRRIITMAINLPALAIAAIQTLDATVLPN